MDKSVEVVKREALAAVLSAAREMLRQVVVPAATGRVENLAGLEAAYVELSGAMERWEEALDDFIAEAIKNADVQLQRWDEVKQHRGADPVAASVSSVLDAFTCRCEVPVLGQLDVCCVCGSFVPAQEAA